MSRLLYVVVHSTDDPDRATTALDAAASAAEAGHEVALWLSGEGVRLAVEGVADALPHEITRAAAASLDVLAEHGVALHVSAPCYANRGFEQAVLGPGATCEVPAALGRLTAEGWNPITL